MVSIRKKNTSKMKHKDKCSSFDIVEKCSKTTITNIDSSSIPVDMTIEEVLMKFFKATDIEEHADGTLSFTTA